MAQAKPQYEHLDEFSELAFQLSSKYPDAFQEVDINLIRPVVITNKERPSKAKKLWTIKPVPMPIRMDCDYSHYVILYFNDWHALSRKHKLLLISQILFAIPVDEIGENEEKVKPFDLNDFYAMQATFGTDWIVNDDIPDILDTTVDWKLPH